MRELILIGTMAAVIIFGYYIMRRLDRFFEENERLLEELSPGVPWETEDEERGNQNQGDQNRGDQNRGDQNQGDQEQRDQEERDQEDPDIRRRQENRMNRKKRKVSVDKSAYL